MQINLFMLVKWFQTLLCANKLINVRWQYLKPFNYVQIKLFMLCPGYDTKQSYAEIPVMLELWGIWSNPSLPSLPGPLWPGVVALDKGPIYGLNITKPWLLDFTVFCI